MSDTIAPPTGLAEPGARLAAQLAAAVVRRIEVPSFVSVSGRAASIRIGEISLGEANVDHVDVSGVETRFSTGRVTLTDAQAIVHVAVVLEWEVWPFSGREDPLVEFDIPFPLPDVEIPALSNIRLDVQSATLDEVRAALQPVSNLDLGGGTFENLRLADTLVPSAGFGLGGLGLGTVRLNDVAVPAVSAASLNLERFAPTGPLVLPSIRVEGVELPAASAPRIESDGSVPVQGVRPVNSPSSRWIGLAGVLAVRVTLEPELDIFIERLVIRNLTASASVDTLQVQNVSAPVVLRDVSLDGLQLEQLTIERITV